MINPKLIINEVEKVKNAMRDRGYDVDIDRVFYLFDKRKKLIIEIEDLLEEERKNEKTNY